MNTYEPTDMAVVETIGVTPPVKNIVINSSKQRKWDRSEIWVKAGEKIKLTLNQLIFPISE